MKRFFTLGVLAVALTVGVLSSPADAARVRFGVGVGPTVGVRGVPNYGYRSYARPYYGNLGYRSFYSPYYGVPYSRARVNSFYYGGGGYGPMYGGGFYGSPYYGGFYGGGNYGGWCN